MKNLFVLILTVLSIVSINATPLGNPLAETSLIDLTCTTNSNLTGLEIANSQTLTGRDANGTVVTIDCKVLSIVVDNKVYLYLSTEGYRTGVVIDIGQNIEFKNVVTGVVSSHAFIITDVIIH